MKRCIIALSILLVVSLGVNLILVLTKAKEDKTEPVVPVRAGGEVRSSKFVLTKAMRQQRTEELNSLRKLAVKERAVKTTGAIDKMLATGQERFAEIVRKMAEEERNRIRERSTRSRVRKRREKQEH